MPRLPKKHADLAASREAFIAAAEEAEVRRTDYENLRDSGAGTDYKPEPCEDVLFSWLDRIEARALDDADPYEKARFSRLVRIEAKKLMDSDDCPSDETTLWDQATQTAAARYIHEPAHITDADLTAHRDVALPKPPETNLPGETPERAAQRQALLDASMNARRLSYQHQRVIEEAVAAGNTGADNPEIVASREAALEATREEGRLQQEFFGG